MEILQRIENWQYYQILWLRRMNIIPKWIAYTITIALCSKHYCILLMQLHMLTYTKNVFIIVCGKEFVGLGQNQKYNFLLLFSLFSPFDMPFVFIEIYLKRIWIQKSNKPLRTNAHIVFFLFLYFVVGGFSFLLFFISK